jgi:hypothetical protein
LGAKSLIFRPVFRESSGSLLMRGNRKMEEDIGAIRGIVLGVATGATLWLMIYVATIL